MIRAVLDCNVVVTAALSEGKCAELLRRARRRNGFELVWSPPIVAECLRVIAYPKLAGRFRTDPASSWSARWTAPRWSRPSSCPRSTS